MKECCGPNYIKADRFFLVEIMIIIMIMIVVITIIIGGDALSLPHLQPDLLAQLRLTVPLDSNQQLLMMMMMITIMMMMVLILLAPHLFKVTFIFQPLDGMCNMCIFSEDLQKVL